MRDSSNATALPSSKAFSTSPRFASNRRTCFSGRRCEARTEQDHGRLSRFPYSEKSAEVSIGRDYDSSVAPGTLENLRVISRLHPVVPHMRGVVSGLPQAHRDERRK